MPKRKKLVLRKWQQEALNRSNPEHSKGIFLEASGGRGKTIAALAIAEHYKAKSVLILNKKLSILKGWEETLDLFPGLKGKVECITDKTFSNRLAKGEKFKPDFLIIDEWQDMCSDNLLKKYKKIKRRFTIGLSATPIRRKGTNFFGLERTIFGESFPSEKFEWQMYWGRMVTDSWTASGIKWEDFRNYDDYLKHLPNFMDFDYIENLENSVANNGYKLETIRFAIPAANPARIKHFEKYNIVTVNNKSAVAKQSFGRNAFLRYLNQTGVDVDFPYLKATNANTPTLVKIDELIRTAPYGLLIVSKSKQIVEIIKERNPDIDIWTGQRKEDNNHKVMVATSQVMGVGVDGLQHRFKAILVLDPVSPESGEYNDYRQLLWRVTGSRQQSDVKIIEFHYQ